MFHHGLDVGLTLLHVELESWAIDPKALKNLIQDTGEAIGEVQIRETPGRFRDVLFLYSAAGLERFLPRMGSGPIPPLRGGLDYV